MVQRNRMDSCIPRWENLRAEGKTGNGSGGKRDFKWRGQFEAEKRPFFNADRRLNLIIISLIKCSKANWNPLRLLPASSPRLRTRSWSSTEKSSVTLRTSPTAFRLLECLCKLRSWLKSRKTLIFWPLFLQVGNLSSLKTFPSFLTSSLQIWKRRQIVGVKQFGETSVGNLLTSITKLWIKKKWDLIWKKTPFPLLILS